MPLLQATVLQRTVPGSCGHITDAPTCPGCPTRSAGEGVHDCVLSIKQRHDASSIALLVGRRAQGNNSSCALTGGQETWTCGVLCHQRRAIPCNICTYLYFEAKCLRQAFSGSECEASEAPPGGCFRKKRFRQALGVQDACLVRQTQLWGSVFMGIPLFGAGTCSQQGNNTAPLGRTGAPRTLRLLQCTALYLP